jgi:hypothetical protein
MTDMNGRFYTDGRRVLRAPKKTKREGGATITMGFALCELCDYADDSAAAAIATALNRMIDSGEISNAP